MRGLSAAALLATMDGDRRQQQLPDKAHQPQWQKSRFPQRNFGKAKIVRRSFQPSWFDRWQWLHYSLKPKKAAGPDKIEAEHLFYGGDLLAAHLTNLFNYTILSGQLPDVFLHGIVIPIPKEHDKDLSLPTNYRGISILSNISKVLDKIVLVRIQEELLPLNHLQGGFRAGHSCLHSAYIYQEAVQSVRERGNKAFVASLDVRKAFDTVWQEGLLVKLRDKGSRGPSGSTSTTATKLPIVLFAGTR